MDKLKILYVEDEKLIMKITKMMFAKIGLQVDCVENAKDAISLFQKNTYDLVLLDIGLPDMDGIQLAEKLRKYEQRFCITNSKIIAVTAYDLDNIRRSCLISGINDVINKPLNIDLLKLLLSKTESIAIH